MNIGLLILYLLFEYLKFDFIFSQMNKIVISILIIVLLLVLFGVIGYFGYNYKKKQSGGAANLVSEMNDSKSIDKSSVATRDADTINPPESNLVKHLESKTFTILFPKSSGSLILVPVVSSGNSIMETAQNLITNAIGNDINITKVDSSTVSSSFFNMLNSGVSSIMKLFQDFVVNIRENSLFKNSSLNGLTPDKIETIFKDYLEHIKQQFDRKFGKIINLITNIKLKGGAESDTQKRRNTEAISISLVMNPSILKTLYDTFMDVLDLKYLFDLIQPYIDISIMNQYVLDIRTELFSDIDLLTKLRTIKYTPTSFGELQKYQDFYLKHNNVLPYALTEYSKSKMLINYFKLLFSYFRYVMKSVLKLIASMLDVNKILNALTNKNLDQTEINRTRLIFNRNNYKI